MFLFFSPFSFLFLSLYFLFLVVLSSLSSFVSYWVVIEFMILLLIGLSFTIFTHRFSSLMSYFIIQTIASFNLLIFFYLGLYEAFMISLFLKLSVFPFSSWYPSVVYRFPNFILLLVRTVHKLPPLLLLLLFPLSFSWSLFFTILRTNLLLSSFFMLNLSDIRMLLLVSSVGNNSWILAASQLTLPVFLLYFVVYSIRLFVVLTQFNSLSKPSLSLVSSQTSSPLSLSLSLLNLAGLPPLPLFFCKIVVIYYMLLGSLLSPSFLFFFAGAALIVSSYVFCALKYFIFCYSTKINFLLFN